MIVLVSGSRKGFTYLEFEKYFKENIELNQVSEIVAGGASGVDTFARIFARRNDIKFTEMSADWDKLGDSAGMKRNQDMVNYVLGKSCLKRLGCILIAFRFDYSSGTSHMIRTSDKEKLNKIVIDKNSFDFN